MELEVRAAAEAAIDDGLLKDDAAYDASAEGLPGHIEAGEPGCPAGRLDCRREHPDRRRLAGAVRSEQPEHLAVGDAKVDALHRFDPARIGLRELIDLDRGGGKQLCRGDHICVVAAVRLSCHLKTPSRAISRRVPLHWFHAYDEIERGDVTEPLRDLEGFLRLSHMRLPLRHIRERRKRKGPDPMKRGYG